MKLLQAVLLSLGLATSLQAADAFTGTWKMNAAKTRYKVGPPAKEQTVTFSDAGPDTLVKIDGITWEGNKLSYSYTIPTAGGPGKLNPPSPWDGVVAKKSGSKSSETSYMKGGKLVYTVKGKVSSDGKTLSVTVAGINAVGSKVSGTTVYDKQ